MREVPRPALHYVPIGRAPERGNTGEVPTEVGRGYDKLAPTEVEVPWIRGCSAQISDEGGRRRHRDGCSCWRARGIAVGVARTIDGVAANAASDAPSPGSRTTSPGCKPREGPVRPFAAYSASTGTSTSCAMRCQLSPGRTTYSSRAWVRGGNVAVGVGVMVLVGSASVSLVAGALSESGVHATQARRTTSQESNVERV